MSYLIRLSKRNRQEKRVPVNGIALCLPLSPGKKYGQHDGHRPGIHKLYSIRRKVNPPGGIGKRASDYREYTHAHTGVHEDRGDFKERIVTRMTSVVSPITLDAVYLAK
jgi:hypothetical protein